MARWKKPKRVKVKRQPDAPEIACDLCGGAITQEEHETVVLFHMSARPCLVPGWEALVAASPDKTVMPVVWGHTLCQSCPTCNPELPAYQAIIDALMRDEDAEPTEGVMTGPPLTWTQAEDMMAAITAGGTFPLKIPEGWWRDGFDKEDVA